MSVKQGSLVLHWPLTSTCIGPKLWINSIKLNQLIKLYLSSNLLKIHNLKVEVSLEGLPVREKLAIVRVLGIRTFNFTFLRKCFLFQNIEDVTEFYEVDEGRLLGRVSQRPESLRPNYVWLQAVERSLVFNSSFNYFYQKVEIFFQQINFYKFYMIKIKYWKKNQSQGVTFFPQRLEN